MSKTITRLAVVGLGTATAVTAALGVGIATDFWHASGSGSGFAKASNANNVLGTADVTTTAASASLEPGSNGDVYVQVTSTKAYTAQFNTVVLSAPSSFGGCTATTALGASDGNPVTLNTAPSNGTGYTVSYDSVAGKTTVTFTAAKTVSSSAPSSFTLTGLVSMKSDADNDCQNANITVPVALSFA